MSGRDKHVDSQDLPENDEAGRVSTEKPTSSEYYESSKTSVEESASEHQTSDISSASFVDVPLAEEIEPNQKIIRTEEDGGIGSLEKPTSSEYCENSKTAVGEKATENQTSDISSGAFADVPLAEIEPNPMRICNEEDDENCSLEKAALERKISDCMEALDLCEDPCSSDYSSNRGSSDPSPEIIYEDIPDEFGEEGYVEVAYNVKIYEKDLVDILVKLRSKHYTVSQEKDPEETVYSNCKSLYEKDYVCEFVDNFGGELSCNYPVRLIVPVKSISTKEGRERAPNFNPTEYTEMVKKSNIARCRSRFVAPVILFDNKLICRSGTLSVRKSAVYEKLTEAKPPQDAAVEKTLLQFGWDMFSNTCSTVNHLVQRGIHALWQLANWNSMEEVRGIDKMILEKLNVEYIIDLMIEDRKKFRNVSVGSSEKINKDIYDTFKIEQMPFPGCAFFKGYHNADRKPDNLIFNWKRTDCEVELMLSEATKLCFPANFLENYKTWDVVKLSRKYLNILLSCLVKGEGGLLVHCISGWDRTPLMISLLRVSLWADRVVHPSLSSKEMAYLTLAYDWYLFGHDLPSRIKKNEEIMHFCFNFISRIATDEFSITKMFENLPHLEKRNRAFPAFEPGRRCKVLNKFSELILDLYKQHITQPVAR